MSDDTPEHPLPRFIHTLAELPRNGLISTQGLAAMFHRSDEAVRAAVDRGELPRPIKLFGGHYWTVGTVLDFLHERLEEQIKEQRSSRAKIRKLHERG